MLQFSTFQSYHTGIEIQRMNMRITLKVPFQSYHTGIEIKIEDLKAQLVTDFQSYHTGIEIGLALAIINQSTSFQSYHTGIEIELAGIGQQLAVASNRTIQELKCPRTVYCSNFIKLPIVPYRN